LSRKSGHEEGKDIINKNTKNTGSRGSKKKYGGGGNQKTKNQKNIKEDHIQDERRVRLGGEEYKKVASGPVKGNTKNEEGRGGKKEGSGSVL